VHSEVQKAAASLKVFVWTKPFCFKDRNFCEGCLASSL